MIRPILAITFAALLVFAGCAKSENERADRAVGRSKLMPVGNPPADAEALADAIEKLMDNPELRKQMGEAGKARVRDQFTLEEMIRKIEAELAG